VQPRTFLVACLRAAALGLFLALIAAPLHALAQGEPQRIVSLDLCTDQLLLELAPRARIAAVTHLASDASVSAIPEKARGIPITHGAAEEVLSYDPDLILAGPFGVTATIGLLRRLQRNLVVVPLAQDLDGVRTAVKTVAQAIGAVTRGEAMLADFDRRLAAVAAPALPAVARPSALLYQVGGVVSGPDSLADAALAAAGYRNKARDYRLAPNGRVPLELIVAEPPDLLLLASRGDDYPTAAADNLRHPALVRLRGKRASLELPWQLWLCGTPHIADAVEQLAAARSRLQGQRP
jgi:iron complex transport system substrate-binding protein